jgi:hypothetical protein
MRRPPLLSLALAGLLLLGRAARAEVEVRGAGDCLDTSGLMGGMTRRLDADATLGARLLKVQILRTRLAATGDTDVQLAISLPRGRTVLERRYRFRPDECGRATELLFLVVDRFLTGLPAEERAVLRRQLLAERPPAAGASTRPALLLWLRAAVSSEWAPTGGDADLGLSLDLVWGRHRLGGSLGVVAALPRALGDGHYQQTTPLAGLSYRLALGGWLPGAELRLGPTLVSGYGYDVNGRATLPWLEVAALLERSWRGVSLGLRVAFAPLQHRAVTEDRLHSEDLSRFKVGLSLSTRLWTRSGSP